MIHKTIDYKHFIKAGFDSKTCSLESISPINKNISRKIEIYNTASIAPCYQHQNSAQEIVNFTVDYSPFVGNSKLLAEGLFLVKSVLDTQYSPEPCTVCEYKKDGSIDEDTKITVNDTIIQKVEFFLHRNEDNNLEHSHIRIRFTLQGLLSK